MQNRITKVCPTKKNKRNDRLRDLLQLTPTDSILLDACARKSPSVVKELLEALPGLNLDTIRDKYLRTPLHIACGRRDDASIANTVAKLLIDAGSDINNGLGDIHGLQPMHMAVLAGNYNCVLMLINEGASIPASDPFRLTPLLLAKLKLDNLKQTHHSIHIGTEEWTSETAKSEYDDLKAITQVLVNHLAKKHINTYGVPSYDKTGYYGLSDFLFSHEDELTELNDVILDITDRLSIIDVNDSSFEETENNNRFIRDSINGLIEKVKELGINEVNHV